jgi:D-alanine-D-alanine ligase-like ATP-grasp enzyme
MTGLKQSDINMYQNIVTRLLRMQGLFFKFRHRYYPSNQQLLRQFARIYEKYYRSYWGSAACSVGAELRELDDQILEISDGKHRTYVRGHRVMLDTHLSLRIAENKHLTYKLLEEAGYRGPSYIVYDLASIPKAAEFMEHLNTMVVIKPMQGTGGGNGITTNIHSRRQLKYASVWASGYDVNLLIERQIPGNSYRLLYLGGRFVDAVRRDPPRVVGDGRCALRKLIAMENRRRAEGDAVLSLCHITTDLECKYHLANAGMLLNYIPVAGESVVVKTVVNQNSYRENHRELMVHPSIIELGERLVSALNLELAGVDIIAPTLAMPLQDSGGVINEINTTPGLHYHDLIADRAGVPDVGKLVLQYIFARQADRPLAGRLCKSCSGEQ